MEENARLSLTSMFVRVEKDSLVSTVNVSTWLIISLSLFRKSIVVFGILTRRAISAFG